jgi:hypothetical protein
MPTEAGRHSSGSEKIPPRGEQGRRRSAGATSGSDAADAAGPASIDEALARARHHGQAALAETLAAVGALLDAASLATSGSAGPGGRLAPLARTLEQLREWLDPGANRDAAALLESFLAALDAEIGRWEKRSSQDPEARAVLRAFLAVRELLWEVGARPSESAPGHSASRAARPGAARVRSDRSGPGARRVRKVPVEG